MSHNGRRNNDEQRERLEKLKKEKDARRKMFLNAGVIGVIALVMGVLLFIGLNQPRGVDYAPAQEIGGDANSTVMTVPVSSAGGSAKFYTYDSGGTQVRFFSVMGSDGKPHIATDACDVCFGSHKGYRQTASTMTCNNCGKSFAINDLGHGNTSGGCWPSYLPMKVDGNNIVIQKSDLDGKAYMFR